VSPDNSPKFDFVKLRSQSAFLLDAEKVQLAPHSHREANMYLNIQPMEIYFKAKGK
jgi:hypothetical protein